MKRICAVLRALVYKIKYGKNLQWSGILRCSNLSEINIKQGTLQIRQGFSMKPGSYIAVVNGGNVSIGRFVSINRNTILVCHDFISIGDCCGIGPNVLIYDHDHKFNTQEEQIGYKTAPVIIENNCWIGAGVIILRGTHIGEGCVIGAGAVVKGDIPPHSLVTSGRDLNITPLEERKK